MDHTTPHTAGTNPDAVQTFLEANPGVDLLQHDFFAAGSAPLSADPALNLRLALRQRLLKVWPATGVARTLESLGYDSAARIAAVPGWKFVRDAGPHLDTEVEPGLAAKVHARALGIHALMQQVYTSLHSERTPYYSGSSFSNPSPEVQDYVSGMPSYQDLFGSLNYCSCSECRSILSPAAYFLDIMRITDQYITQPNQSSIQPGFSLRERRPDLFGIPLDCANTNDPVPYLQVVNEVLETRMEAGLQVTNGTAQSGTASTLVLASGASTTSGIYAGMVLAITSGTGSGQVRLITAYDGSTLTATVDRTYTPVPDNTSQYSINKDIYSQLAIAPYPFNLPDNLPLVQSRMYMGALGSSLTGVYTNFGYPLQFGNPQSVTDLSLTLSNSASQTTGAYDQMRIAIVSGTGPGQQRLILSYDGATRIATIDKAWTTNPDTTSLYYIADSNPVWLESLSLSIERVAQLTTPLTTGPALSPEYGYANLADATLVSTLTPLAMFMERTQLLREEVVQLLVQDLSPSEIAAGLAADFYINNTGENIAPMQLGSSTGTDVYETVENLTVLRLDRMNRFVRLKAALDWSYATLNWVLQALTETDITLPALRGIAQVKILCGQTQWSPEVACSTWTILKDIGAVSDKTPLDLFDVVFNNPALLKGKDPYTATSYLPFNPRTQGGQLWTPSDNTGVNAAIRSRLCAALSLGDNDLSLLAGYVYSQVTPTQPTLNPASSAPTPSNTASLVAAAPIQIAMSYENLAWMYRTALMARQSKLSIDAFLLFQCLYLYPNATSYAAPAYGSYLPSPGMTTLVLEGTGWLQSNGINSYGLRYVLTGIRSAQTPGKDYNAVTVQQFIQSFSTLSESSRIPADAFVYADTDPDGSALIFQGMVAKGYIDPWGIVLSGILSFEAVSPFYLVSSSDFTGANIDAAAAGQVFTLLSQQPAGDPILVDVTTSNELTTAQLSPDYRDYTSLDFLFASQGAGQQGNITAYTGSTHSATISSNWTTLPGLTSWYMVIFQVLTGNTAAAGPDFITLAAGASPDDGAYNDMLLTIASGTGAGATNRILSYTGSNLTAVMMDEWVTVPDQTSVYQISSIRNMGFAQGGDTNTIILDATASTTDDAYNGCSILIMDEPKAVLKREEVRKKLGAFRSSILHTTDLLPRYETLQDQNCLQGLSDFLQTQTELVSVLLPFAASVIDLTTYLPALMDPIATDLSRSFLPAVTPDSFVCDLIPASQSAEAYGQLQTASPQVILPNTLPSWLPQSGIVSDSFTAATDLSYLFTGDSQALLKQAYVRDILLLSQRALKVYRLVQALARSLMLVDMLGLKPKEISSILHHPNCCQIGNVDKLSVTDIQSITAYQGLINAYGKTATEWDAFFLQSKQAGCPNTKVEILALLTGWNVNQLCTLIGLFWPSDDLSLATGGYGSLQGVYRLKRCFDQSRQTGMDINGLLQVNSLSTLPLVDGSGNPVNANWVIYEQTAQTLFSSVNSKLSDEAFFSVSESLNKTLITRRRDALLDYSVWQLNATLPAITRPSDLYQYLLIDVEMSACDNVSYIAQGIGSVQLYMQRCRMMLEPGVTDISQIGSAWWEWMMAYRVWEANRKIFLYPEDYVDPTLLKGVSPAFRTFSDALQQSNIDKTSVTKAYRDYMSDFTLVSTLNMADSYMTQVKDERSALALNRLFLIGKTSQDPPVYYYRTFDNNYSWTPWKPVNVTIKSPYVTPVFAFNRLFLFWLEQTPVAASSIVSNNSIPNSTTTSTLNFSFLDADGKWSSPQALPGFVSIWYEESYQFDNYLATIFPALYQYMYNTQYTWWLKPYPLFLPEASFQQPTQYPNLESIALCYGWSYNTNGQKMLPPSAPSASEPAAQYQLETTGFSFINQYNAVTASLQGIPYSCNIPLRDSVFIDNGLNQQNISTVLLNYLPTTQAIPYNLLFSRGLNQLGAMVSTSMNLVRDNYFMDDLNTVSNGQTGATAKPLLNNISANTATLTTVKNLMGSAVFNNGDESYLVSSQEPGIQYISSLIATNAVYKPLPAGNVYLYTGAYTTTPSGFNNIGFSFYRLTTRTGKVFAGTLQMGGVDALLTLDNQRLSEYPFGRLQPVPPAVLIGNDVMDFNGAYGQYFWEIFFYGPFLVANSLNINQQFEEAMKWYQYIFNPTQAPAVGNDPDPNRFWRFQPFTVMDLPSLIEVLTNPANIAAYNNDPFNPDVIARLRPSAYAKAIVIKYINNLINWADFLYSQDTRESITQATNLYVMASDLLGPRPELIGDCPVSKPLNFDQVQAMYNNQTVTTGQAQGATQQGITLAFGSSDQTDAYTGMYIQITGGTGNGQVNFITRYAALTQQATVSAPWTTIPDSTSQYRIYLDHIPQFFIRLENSAFNPAGVDVLPNSAAFNSIPSYFCVPENSELIACWDTVEDRLFKIRHCMNLQGEVRPLALFAPPINPRDLIARAAAGGSGIPTSGQLDAPIPNFRFTIMLEKTRQFAASVIQFGAALLSALEKNDGEALALLNNSQAQVLLGMNTFIKEQQVNQAIANKAALQESLLSAQQRYNYYSTLVSKGLNAGEVLHIEEMDSALMYNILSSATTTASSIGFAVPNVGSPFAMTYGGQQIGSALMAAAGVFQILASMADYNAQLAILMAGYQRRSREWQFQADQAQLDIQNIQYQLQAGDIQQQIAARDYQVHLQTIAQTEGIQAFLQNKFTNQELYQWMISRLSTVYFQAYTLTYELARLTQRAYQYEMRTSQTFINFGYWDNLRKGLLAGESLSLSLMQMEKAWVDKNIRPLEIEKTISLRMLDPVALLSLLHTGECIFSFGEKLFDDDYPGHYARQMRSLQVSIPAVLGPYQNFHVTLTQMSNQLVLQPDINAINFLLGGNSAGTPAANVLRTNWWINQQVAISSGNSDSGVFETANTDGRYLPFEDTGAVSTWKLQMPKGTNNFLYSAVSDIVFELRYTAFNGGSTLRSAVLQLDAMQTREGNWFKNMAQNFSQDWYTFMNVHPSTTQQTLSFTVEGLVPPNIQDPVLTGFYFQLEVPGGINTEGTGNYLTLQLGSSTSQSFNTGSGNAFAYAFPSPPPQSAITGSASLVVDLGQAPPALLTKGTPGYLDPGVLRSAVLILFWRGRMMN